VDSISAAFTEWLAMGGYAAFVWPAYAVAAAALGGLAWQSWRAHRASGRDLARLQRRSDGG
jgi:heme exporter protein D